MAVAQGVLVVAAAVYPIVAAVVAVQAVFRLFHTLRFFPAVSGSSTACCLG